MAHTVKKAASKNTRSMPKEQQQKNMKRLVWITCACIAAIIAVIVITQPSSDPVPFAYEKLPRLGNADAPVKIVEFGDYKCPVCQLFNQQIKPQLMQDYIDKGLVSFYFMNDTFIGPDSYTAALAAQSVFHQSPEDFWKFFDAVYQNQGDENTEWATPEFLVELARKENLPIDYDKLKQDIQNETYGAEVDEHNAYAQKIGVTSTPTLFINGQKFENTFDYNALKTAIDQAVKGGS
ncbi:DsbA family protein [Brevibacillus massiliensis]|uniref:DsbA family protein n=2 Tax=Brevibacillus massiliensis TaxID=1118054 RepID=UPI00031C8095|nr:thioredoxin domain-containing protein [Brevibacillus massiliensis]